MQWNGKEKRTRNRSLELYLTACSLVHSRRRIAAENGERWCTDVAAAKQKDDEEDAEDEGEGRGDGDGDGDSANEGRE